MRRIADDGRIVRIAAGLSQGEVGRAIGASHARVGRFERGDVEFPDLEFLGAYCAVLGLELSLRTYPAGDPIRDRAQLALLERFRARLHPSLRWRTEVPLPIERDLRAWDADIRGTVPAPWRARVEAETKLADLQALERRLTLKHRDDPAGHLILLISDTRANRAGLLSVREGLGELLPLRTREVLAAIAEGRDPAASGIVIL
ncbi:MAG TPA: helix-turn-helix transcriptional regulator [Candidatus Limnocylindrales bacterium]|nr:helix-turn-helix transcriptional regulator [Candidatus Limnocylindrales bacterium]